MAHSQQQLRCDDTAHDSAQVNGVVLNYAYAGCDR